jgi:uncharacterized RDD family membrane protein YckC
MDLYQEDRELVRSRAPRWEGYALSGWWRRVGAWLIDGFVVSVIGIFVFTVVDEVGTPTVEWWDAIGIAAVSALAYYPALMRATNGRTLGKLATRIRVVRTDHEPMSFARAAWREVVVKTAVLTGIPYAGVLINLVNGLWPLWDPQNRAIHDMLAGTRVVRAHVPRVPADTGATGLSA